MNKQYKIFLSGGGTAGSVSPLLAVAEELIKQDKYSKNDNIALCFFARTTNSYYLTQSQKEDLQQSLPPSLGLVGDWKREESADDKFLIFRAYEHILKVYPFVLEGGKIKDAHWHSDTIQIKEQNIPIFRADNKHIYSGCLVQLYDSSTAAPLDSKITCIQTDQEIFIQSSCGLVIHLVCMPSGEMIEVRNTDWRTIPLFNSPAHNLWPGDLVKKNIITKERKI